jgi:hypothetical protein
MRGWRIESSTLFVYPVDVVHLVSLVQPNKQDKPNNSLFPLAGFFSILLMGFGALDRSNLGQY